MTNSRARSAHPTTRALLCGASPSGGSAHWDLYDHLSAAWPDLVLLDRPALVEAVGGSEVMAELLRSTYLTCAELVVADHRLDRVMRRVFQTRLLTSATELERLLAWKQLGEIDVLLLPVDGSQHVLSYAQADAVAAKLDARIIVPHHYGIWDVTTISSTLLPPDDWVNGRAGSIWTESGSFRLDPTFVKQQQNRVVCFGGHVAFDKADMRRKSKRA